MLGVSPATDADLYLALQLESNELFDVTKSFATLERYPKLEIPAADKTKLFYYVNKLTSVDCFCILPSVALDLLGIAHGEGHLSFAQYYKRISCSWFVQRLTKLLRSFIRHCPQCLALQTRRHPPYGSLQPIDFPLVPFFTLTLNFVLTLSASKKGYNALMSFTCKFLKQIKLIKGVDTWTAEQWAQAFLKRLKLIDRGLPGKLMTDQDPKFLSKFWTALLDKLGIKLLYSTIYHPQTDGSSKCTNQIIDIALRFFVHALKNPTL